MEELHRVQFHCRQLWLIIDEGLAACTGLPEGRDGANGHFGPRRSFCGADGKSRS